MLPVFFGEGVLVGVKKKGLTMGLYFFQDIPRHGSTSASKGSPCQLLNYISGPVYRLDEHSPLAVFRNFSWCVGVSENMSFKSAYRLSPHLTSGPSPTIPQGKEARAGCGISSSPILSTHGGIHLSLFTLCHLVFLFLLLICKGRGLLI